MSRLQLMIDPDGRPHGLYEGVEYEEFWNGVRRRRLDELEHAIVQNLLPVSGHRIVDVGCGYGRLADCYLGRFQQVIMVDGSMSLLRQAFEQTRGKATCIASDVAHLPLRTACCDAALMIRVFHHIQDSQACLSELHRILCSAGKLIFSYRNKSNALRAMQRLVGKDIVNPFVTEPATFISHYPKAVHRMLLETNFVDIRYYGAGVSEWLSARLGSMGRWVPPGEWLAGFLGNSKIAPWILCGAIARGDTDLIDARGIGDLLQCPCCGGGLSDDRQGYLCHTCERRYPVADGIIDLRV
jgi:ubiquinone/menaquinone biosynthesis C-methylase UbiE